MVDDHKYLWQFEMNCGRMGVLNGIFSATQSEIDELYGKHIYFGEVLGKHSEIWIDNFNEKYLTRLTDDQSFIDTYDSLIGASGYNPLEYYEDEDEDGE